jgi:hypothetical protein
MRRSLDRELTARQLELENAMAELFKLREQVSMAERSILDSDLTRSATKDMTFLPFGHNASDISF